MPNRLFGHYGNEIPARLPVRREGSVQVAERLGGLLKWYHPAAA